MNNSAAAPLNLTLKSDEVLQFEENLNSRVINQPEAVKALTGIYEQYLAGIPKNNRPLGTMLLLGLTGTGKSLIAKALAESIYGNPKALFKVNCTEYQSSHEISKLVGAPPGYVGHGAPNASSVITQEKLDQFHDEHHKISIVLFDEIEKASSALYDLLLGILEEGILVTGRGETIDFSKSIILMTSNIGAAEMTNTATGKLGFSGKDVTDQAIASVAHTAVKKKFSPEFINRIDHMVVFNTLDQLQMKAILKVELKDVQKRIFTSDKQCQFVLSLSDEAESFVIADGYDKRYGARHLKRSIEKNIVNKLASLILTTQIELGDVVHISVKNNTLDFHKISSEETLEQEAEKQFLAFLEAEASA